MIANIFVFEDNKYSNFLPLTYLRPVYDLVCGGATLLAKIVRNFSEANISLHCREYLKNIVKQNHAGIGVNNVNTAIGCLFVNGRILAPRNFEKLLNLDGRDRIFINDNDEVIAMYLNTKNLYLAKDLGEDIITSKELLSRFRNKTEVTHLKVKLVEYPWELVKECAQQLKEDYDAVVSSGIVRGEIHPNASIIEEYKLYVGENSKIYPGVTLNAENGPIYIGENCQIKPQTYIEGPAFIGNHSVISNAYIMAGTSIGPKTYVTGQIKNSILHGYSNIDNASLKNSYLADAVDIAPHTFNQDYISPFSHQSDIYIDGYEVKTSEQYLGLFCADFSKIGPQLTITPGTVIGISTYNEHGHSVMPKYIPSFIRQVSETKYDELSTHKAMEMIKHNLNLKSIEFTKAEQDLVEYVHSKFSSDRKVSKIIY